MPVACTSSSLAELAACLTGLSPKQQAAIQTYLLCQIANGGTSRSYVALLTQSGSAAPVATVLENTLGFTPAWSRFGQGIYNLTQASGFPASRTFYNILASNDAAVSFLAGVRSVSDSILQVSTGDIIGGTNNDDLLFLTPFEIRIYP